MTWQQAATQRWESLVPREKLMVASAAAVVGIALAWWVLFAPALGVLRGAEAQHRTLDAQRQQMARLQAQAQALQAQPKQPHDEAMRLLEQAIRQQLGVSARYTIQNDRVTVTLTGTPAEVLAQWLVQARATARALPSEARLQRNAAGLWEGTLVLNLPPR
ncbi:MAG: type II secretion system protein M [Burkholderiales bacterium]|nr:type II secretion system protein M [Burkholderiales bacterium]